MKKLTIQLIVVFTILLSISLVACKNDNIENEETNKKIFVEKEEAIQKLFVENASYYDDCYRFSEYNTLDNTTYLYSFVYSPDLKLFNANLLVTTETETKMYDYGAITFTWGDFKSGYFYGYHEYEKISKIEFEFEVLSYKYNIGDNYDYKVKSNTYANLTEKEDIDIYAQRDYECLKQIVPFIKKILSKYDLSTNLW